MQKIFNFRGLLLAGVVIFGNPWALACTARTPEAAAQEWLQQQQTAQIFQANAVKPQNNNADGYVVQRTFSDSALGVQWVLVGDCAHPSRPLIAVALPKRKLRVARISQPAQAALPATEIPDYSPAHVRLLTTETASDSGVSFQAVKSTFINPTVVHSNTPAPVLVRAGDRVVLWNQEPELRMEIAATALEYGRAGQVIHLRRGGTNTSWNSTMTGVVRGPGSVELMP